MQERVIAIIATLDTKGPETAFVKSRIEASGFGTLILDTGILERRSPEGPHPEVSANVIALEGGEDRRDLIARSSEKETRNRGIRAMSKGSARILRKLYDEGRICGVIGLGGAQGTEISTYAMRALPLGVPKVMVSTVASGQTPFGIYTGTKDITIYGQTTPAALAIKPRLESMGYEVFAFHSNGTGGKAMEELAVENMLDVIFDLSTHEITDELFGGIHASDSQRLLAGGIKGIPRLVVPGALDLITLGEPETIPEAYRSQPSVRHNPHITLVRLTAAQMMCVAEVVAGRLNQAKGPVIVAIPKGGYSFYNRDGLHFRNVEADRLFVETLRSILKPGIPIIEIESHVNDPLFVEEILFVFENLTRNLRKTEASAH
jgi:uncharacterized protein (UPF0261 family)